MHISPNINKQTEIFFLYIFVLFVYLFLILFFIFLLLLFLCVSGLIFKQSAYDCSLTCQYLCYAKSCINNFVPANAP